MKLLLKILFIALVAKISHSLPIGSGEPLFPTRPDFMKAVVQYTKSQAESTTAMIHNVLLQMPKTQEYDLHRKNLHQLLVHAENVKRPGHCHTKIHRFSKHLGEVIMSYVPSNASFEHRVILKLMEENGLRDMMLEADAFLGNIIRGELGTPVEAGSPEFASFLTKDC